MSKIEEIRNDYLKDADSHGSKNKFGFFSMPPCATAGHNAFEQKTVIKDENGKVKTQERGIYPGRENTGMLKKSFFKYETSVYQGDPFLDPGKYQRKQNLLQSKKLEGKEVYKPLSTNKTPDPKASYEHIGIKPVKKLVKDCVDSNGKIITQERNIYTNPQSKVEKEKLKEIKYIPDPYQNFRKVETEEMKRSINLRGEVNFRSASPVKEYFATARQLFGNNGVPTNTERAPKKPYQAPSNHDSKFRPSCVKNYDTFSYPGYKPGGYQQPLPKVERKGQSAQTFKPTKTPNKFKPSPSISTMKSNLLRSVR